MKNLEASAIAIIDEALSKLGDDKEAQKRVLNWASQKYSIILMGSSTEKQQNGFGDKSQSSETKDMNIKDFMVSKKPKNGYQRLACLAYYLEKYKEYKDFNAKDLKQANSDAKQTKISNIPAYLRDATAKYGFFTPTAKGKKSLTTCGEAVVKALPDQGKAKDAMKEHKMRKKKKKSKKQ